MSTNAPKLRRTVWGLAVVCESASTGANVHSSRALLEPYEEATFEFSADRQSRIEWVGLLPGVWCVGIGGDFLDQTYQDGDAPLEALAKRYTSADLVDLRERMSVEELLAWIKSEPSGEEALLYYRLHNAIVCSTRERIRVRVRNDNREARHASVTLGGLSVERRT